MKKSLFPSRLAVGSAFCNRAIERNLLKKNIDDIRHTLIISPRRYGKTSLAMQVFREEKCVYAYINLFNALQNDSVVLRFSKGLSELLNQLIPTPQKALQKLMGIVKRVNLSLELKDMKASFGLKPSTTDPLESISQLLEDIEAVLESEGKQAVIFLDEFQDLVKTEMSDELQAVLRDFAQRTQHLAFIISGSHRRMLNKIFDDRNKPFYKLCDRINLERIKPEDHEKFIQKHAMEKWENFLPEKVLRLILKMTECHSYYVNRLCAKLWAVEALPSEKVVLQAWNILKEEEYDSVVSDVDLLSRNQRIVLGAIAKADCFSEPTSQKSAGALKVPASTIRQALDVLIKHDFVEPFEGGFRLIDPLLKSIMSAELE